MRTKALPFFSQNVKKFTGCPRSRQSWALDSPTQTTPIIYGDVIRGALRNGVQRLNARLRGGDRSRSLRRLMADLFERLEKFFSRINGVVLGLFRWSLIASLALMTGIVVVSVFCTFGTWLLIDCRIALQAGRALAMFSWGSVDCGSMCLCFNFSCIHVFSNENRKMKHINS